MELHGGSPARVLNILALPKREPTYDTDTGSHRHNAGYTQPLTYCFLPTTRAASGGSLSLPSHPILRPTTTTYYILSTTHTRTHSQGHAHSLGSDAARQRCLLSRQRCRHLPVAMPSHRQRCRSLSPSLPSSTLRTKSTTALTDVPVFHAGGVSCLLESAPSAGVSPAGPQPSTHR